MSPRAHLSGRRRSGALLCAVAALVLGLSLLILPAAAHAQQCVGTPDASATDQYCETLDTAGGGSAPSTGGGLPQTSAPTLREALPPSVVRALMRDPALAALLDLPTEIAAVVRAAERGEDVTIDPDDFLTGALADEDPAETERNIVQQIARSSIRGGLTPVILAAVSFALLGSAIALRWSRP